jgi:tetratricopeptide (TPR) repeat protein
VGAVLFGKYHAVGFLPGLVLFLVLRDRGFRSAAACVAGGTAIFLAWLFALFLPHRAEIAAHVAQQSTGLHGAPPLLRSLAEGAGEFFNTVRRSWVFYRMPIAGSVGGLFAMWVVLNPRARDARTRDGSAIFALWLASQWIYYALLPYKAPRYFVLLVPALCGAAAAGLELAVRAGGARLRPPQTAGEHAPLALWIYAFLFTSIDAIKHYASMVLEWLTQPPSRISEGAYGALVDFFAHLDTFRQGLFWSAVAGIVLYVGVLWHPEILRLLRRSATLSGAALRRGAAVLVFLEAAAGLGSWAWLAGHRTYSLEDVKAAFPTMVRDEAVILGAFAPALTQDSPHRSLPYFGPPGERGLLERYGVTHVFVCGEGDRKAMEERYPGLLDSTAVVQVWPLRTLFASTVELRRLPPAWNGVPIHRYAPTVYERAAEAAAAGRWEEALRLFGEFRAGGGKETPDLVSLEAVCWFKLERYAEAEKRLDRVLAARPRDPLAWRNLGILHLRRGERAEALDALMHSYRLDPENDDLRKMVEELRR